MGALTGSIRQASRAIGPIDRAWPNWFVYCRRPTRRRRETGTAAQVHNGKFITESAPQGPRDWREKLVGQSPRAPSSCDPWSSRALARWRKIAASRDWQTQVVSVAQGSDRGLDRQPIRDEFAPVERLQNATAGRTAKLGLFATDRVELHSTESCSTFRAHHIAFSHVGLLRAALQ